MTDRISHTLTRLSSDGWAPLALSSDEITMLRNLNEATAAFFHAPSDVRALSQWDGEGMWAGFQPMPDGDPDVIDLVDRFEVAADHLGRAAGQWPWLSDPAAALRIALQQVQGWAQSIVSECVGSFAELNGLTAQAAQQLWCADDSSTLVVNSYRLHGTETAALAELMKPHADFGGLTIIHTCDGLDALQFIHDGAWQAARQPDAPDEAIAVLLIGQLFAHWLGIQAPIHRVTRQPAATTRMSTVYFHQPNLSALIPGKDGQPHLHAGQHITAMQEHYNQLGTAPQTAAS